jgi:hypothetical protein
LSEKNRHRGHKKGTTLILRDSKKAVPDDLVNLKNMTRLTYFKIIRFKPGRLYFRLFTKLLIFLFIIPCLLITRPSHAQSKSYSICFGSYKNIKYAEEAISRLQKQNYDAFYRYVEVRGKGKFYRVYVGRFNSKEEAKTKAEQLINSGIMSSDYFINVLFGKDQTDLSEVKGKETHKILNDSAIEEDKELETKTREKTKPDILKIENPVYITDILFIKTQMGSEILHIYSNRLVVPDVSYIEGNNPQVVVDINDVVSIKKGLSEIDVNWKFIRTFRSHLYDNSNKLRIILDLVPEKDYSIEHFFYEKENILYLGVKEKDTE